MEKAPGAAAFDHPDIEEAVMLAASAMAAYHGTSVRLGARNAYTIPFGIEHAWSRTRRVRLVAPLLAARGEEVLHRLEEQADDVSAAHVFVHSDFKGSQLLIGDGRVAVVDLDSSRLGDPAVDAGGFLADMRKEAVLRGRDELRTFDDAFLRASVARHPSGRGLERRARVFRVVALVRMAMHAFRQDPGGYSEDDETYTAHALLNEAEECLRDL